MELSEEQYIAVMKYVSDEMDAAEKEAFEDRLGKNSSLIEEIDFCKEIKLISSSISRKAEHATHHIFTQEIPEEIVLSMVKKARENWEINHEDNFRKEFESPQIEQEVIANSTNSNLKENEELFSGLQISNGFLDEKNKRKVRFKYRIKWRAIGIFIGVTLSGLIAFFKTDIIQLLKWMIRHLWQLSPHF